VTAIAPLRSLFVAILAAPLASLCPDSDQDPATEDWARHVDKACHSRRYGLRLAAARKVAGGGDAAVPAVEAYSVEHGLNALPAALVDAIADSGKAGPKVSRLLWSWTMNPDFFWRSSAMRGLALRIRAYKDSGEDGEAPGLDFAQVNYLMSVRAENDPAWLMRTHARLGLILGGQPLEDVFWTPEPDPRARVRLATLLLREGVTPPMQPLVDALADQRTFLGTPWGANLATEASKALRRWLGDKFPKVEGGSNKAAAIKAVIKTLEAQLDEALLTPRTQTDLATDITGGVELLSCKFGDKFVQWDNEGTIYFGIDSSHSVQLRDDDWRSLSKDRSALALKKSLGVVICDSLRIADLSDKVSVKIAPSSLPKTPSDWLKRLAQRLEKAGEDERAADLRRGLGQFEER